MKQIRSIVPPFTPSASLLKPLVAWFEEIRRTLPWRAQDLDVLHPDPYAVLVSELMLQQTQVATVIPYFQRWMVRFPDVSALARASDDEIHLYWEGLGYYRRASHLRAATTAIAHNGWPPDLMGLLALPGLGPYTAAALASIAFQMPEPALDGNAFRVLARVLGLREDPRQYAEILREWLRPALETHGPSRLTQAIMELGALRCLPTPHCESCPLQRTCEAQRLDLTRDIPPRRTRVPPKDVELCLVALEAEGCWLLHMPIQGGLLGGLWCWPSFEGPTTVQEELAAEASSPYSALTGFAWSGWVQLYSHRREHVRPIAIHLPTKVEAPQGLRWISSATLAKLPLGKRDQRLRELVKESGTGNSLDLRIPQLLKQIFQVSH